MIVRGAGLEQARDRGQDRSGNRDHDRPRVLGPTADDETRCVHYQTRLDVIAIRFACCGEYYPCNLCHEEAADHPAQTWPA